MNDYPDMVGSIDFNYDNDKKEFGINLQRIVSISAYIDDEGIPKISISFELGRKEDDTVTLSIDAEEFMQKISKAMLYGENYDGGKK